MATPARRSLFTQLKTQLEAISTGSGYKTTVGAVELTAKDWSSARKESTMPYIGIKPGVTEYAYQPSDCVRSVLAVDLALHLQPDTATDAARYDAMQDFIDDVFRAINTDHTLGDNAVNCIVRRDVTDEGDPDATDSTGVGVSAVVTLEVVFNRTQGGS